MNCALSVLQMGNMEVVLPADKGEGTRNSSLVVFGGGC